MIDLKHYTLAAFVLSSSACSVSDKQCDPNNPQFGDTLVCQQAYAKRLQQAKDENQELHYQVDQRETSLADVNLERDRANRRLQSIVAKVEDNEARIASLKRNSQASDGEISRLEQKLREVSETIASLKTQLSSDKSQNVDSEEIDQLRAEQAELEELLLELEA